MKYLIAIVFLFASCSKNTTGTMQANATILFTGEPAVDGCGWLVSTDNNHDYSPDNLPDNFKQSGLKVFITYNVTKDSISCGDIVLTRLPVIHLANIRKQ